MQLRNKSPNEQLIFTSSCCRWWVHRTFLPTFFFLFSDLRWRDFSYCTIKSALGNIGTLAHTQKWCAQTVFFFFFQKRDYGVPEGRFAQSQYLEIISRYCILWLAPERGRGNPHTPLDIGIELFNPRFQLCCPHNALVLGFVFEINLFWRLLLLLFLLVVVLLLLALVLLIVLEWIISFIITFIK